MAANETERPPEAIKAAKALVSNEEMEVVGIGDFVAFYASHIGDEFAEGTIFVCRVGPFDHCETQDRVAAHSDVLFELDQSDPVLTGAPNEAVA
jgi:hypothetical protein